jgi:hypothetical protein
MHKCIRTECFCPNLSDHDVNVCKFVVISWHYKTTLLVWKTYEYRLLFNSQEVSHKQYNLNYFEWFLISCSSPQTFRIYRDRRQTYRPFRRHDRFKSDFRQSIARITAKPCVQKLIFLCFRQVLILCMLCTDYYNNFTTYSYLFFPDTIMPVFVPPLVV